MHMLQSGFDITVIAMWLGHEAKSEVKVKDGCGNILTERAWGTSS